MRYTLLIAALAATTISASPAFAQQATATVNNATVKGTVLLPLTLSETQKLDFGTVIASTTGAGNVVIDAATGARSFPQGNVVGVPSYPGQNGSFQGAGTAGRTVALTLNAPVVLTSGTNTLAVNSMTFDGCAATCSSTTRTLDPVTGAFTVGVGGDFQIAQNQPNGVYSSTYTVTADYQ
jgi:hypothetical protein